MNSQFGDEFRAGIAIFEKVCSKNSLTCTWKTAPFAGDSVRFTLSKGGHELRIRLGRDFVSDLPGTKEFQSALELYLTEVALRLGEPNFEEYATMSGIPVRFRIEFPFRRSTDGGSFEFVHVLTESGTETVFEAKFSVHLTHTIAVQVVSLESVITEPLVINAVRKFIDSKQAGFHPQGEHPVDLQVVTIESSAYDYKAKRFVYYRATEEEITAFLKRKVYWLGFRRGNQATRVCIADPYDAAYLGISTQRLQQTSAILAADGCVQIDSSGLYANAATKLLLEARGFDSERAAFFKEESPARGSIPLSSRTSAPEGSHLFDVFVSHATEDKSYVEPLVKALEAAGIRVWYDKSALEWGDDLRSAIDRGLSNCRYGIVIFSKAFLGKKKWTEYELNSLFALERVGRKVILPIWHGITRDDLIQYSPAFADRLAKILSTDSHGEIVEGMLAMLGRAKPTTSSEPPSDTKKTTKMQTMSIREELPLKSSSMVPLSDRKTEVIASSVGNTPYSRAPIPPQTEAARRLCDATRDLQKAAWSYVELRSRYGVAQAVSDVVAEEKKIFEKIDAALDVFERDYDLPADLANAAKEELANINISLDRLKSAHDLETVKIAAEQVQDSCHRIRHAAKPYVYLNADAGDASRVQETELPTARPIIVPKRYGGGVVKDDMGYTGLGVINDGEPAYDVTISNISIKDGARLEFHRGHTERLAKTDGEAFYPAFVGMKLGGTFGSELFDFMRERAVQRLTVPIRYRDFANNWFQTDVTLERDVEKSGGLRLGWTQKLIPDPISEAMTISSAATSIVIEPAQAVTRNVERVLSVMTEHKNWRRTDLAKLANIGDDDALQALRALKDADKVIPIDVDEEPKNTFWRRI